LSLVGPKARPQGVVDGCQVEIPEPGALVEYAGTLLWGRQWCWSSTTGDYLPVVRRRRGRENLRRRVHSTVPQTDTGGRVEDTKAFEITIVKELGKMAP